MEFIDQADAREITLSLEDALDPMLAIPPSQRTFGSAADLELTKGRVRLRIGDRPIVRNLRALNRRMGKKLPPELEVFSDYNIWLIAFSVGILRPSGFPEVVRFGFAATFADTPRVTILDLLPQTRFVTKAGAELKAEAALALNGSARLPASLTQVLAQTDVLSADASLRLSTEANWVGLLSFSVSTPVIQAIGIGGSHAEWLFEKEDHPLTGDQHVFVTLLAPKPVTELETTIRLSATFTTPFMPTTLSKRRIAEKEITLRVPLEALRGLD